MLTSVTFAYSVDVSIAFIDNITLCFPAVNLIVTLTDTGIRLVFWLPRLMNGFCHRAYSLLRL